tara:strand:- start:2881 stop:3708 length:828 start_codon:yes stop_codon:yes gene_type:complete
MKVPFYKCNSKGNSFIIIFPSSSIILSNFQIKKICQSASNELVDGLILLDIDKNRQIASMHYYNNDGTWETFCLNGTICCSLVLENNRLFPNYIKTDAGLYGIKVLEDNLVKIELSKPINISFNKFENTWEEEPNNNFSSILIDGFRAYYINSGARHIVIKSDEDVFFKDDLNLEKTLKKIRNNKLFLPDGVNVNIYRSISSDSIQVKTYEKGVESMMSSCSSGSYACAYHYYYYYKLDKLKILNDGGISEVMFGKNKNLFLSKGKIEYKGELEI